MVDIQISDITLKYDEFVAIDDISFSIKDGELVTILGPSGCGKTTLLRSIAGFIRPSAGTILIGGNDVTNLPPQKRNTAMIFQNYALWPHMTINKNIEYGLRIKGIPKEERMRKVREMLNMVQLADQGEKMPTQLSGGQQQRIALARAMAVDPEVLLCDEPLSNLDANLRIELRQEIRDIAKNLGVTTVYVTHDQSEALSISDRIVVLHSGVIRQIGPPESIFNDPDDLFISQFIGDSNSLQGTISNASPGATIVEFGSGESLTLPIANAPAKGSVVTVVARPNETPLSKEATDHSVEVEVEYATFMGDFTRVLVTMMDGKRLVVKEEKKVASEFSVGDQYYLTFSTDKTHIFYEGIRAR
ncbi:MAG: ABC transporter ATP-binding protein [Candidatus Kariarchaeaceae archaeon]